MREVELRINAYLDPDRQWQRKSHRLPNGRALIVVMVAVVVVVAIGNGQLGSGSNQLGAVLAHTAVVHGTDVRGERVLALVDDSGSMSDKGAEVLSQLDRLKSAGLSITNQVNVFGFAISFQERYTLLKNLETALATDPSIDTVYVITDFYGVDYRANQPEAFERMRELLTSHNVRFYWATVSEEPIQEYKELARQSGGCVIPKF